jgi:methionyl-tRNA formyltransferase
MRIIFAGTPNVAIPTLELLITSGYEVVGVLTREDSPVGRKKVITPSPVASFAELHGLPVFKANVLSPDFEQIIRDLKADVGIVIAFGALLTTTFLNTTEHGWFNLHFSQLPTYRGAAPAQWAIRNGDSSTGSTLFKIDEGLDTGDVFSTTQCEILPDETSGQLLERMSHECGKQVLSLLAAIENSGSVPLMPQQGDASLAPKLRSEDGQLDLSYPSSIVYDRFRSVTPEPGAFILITGERFKIITARHEPEISLPQSTIAEHDNQVYLGCSHGALRLLEVQPAGKKSMKANDWWRGIHVDSLEVDK